MKYRTALITGASSGLGRELSLLVARDGTEVALAARGADALGDVAEEIRGAGGVARVVPMDVTDAEATQAAIGDLDDDMGGIDLVVANAGVSKPRWSGKLQWEHCHATIDVNITGLVATLTALLPQMLERKSGHLVGVSSLAQYRGMPKFAVYSGSKAFVSTFLESLRVDLRGVGIKVTDIRPGYVRTPMNEGAKLPFTIDADVAARAMWKGIQGQQGVVEFPWTARAFIRSASTLPNAAFDQVAPKLFG